MKKIPVLIVVAVVLAVALIGPLGTYISPGTVGVQVSMNGGVQKKLLKSGFHIKSPFSRVEKFSVANEQLVLSKDEREGSEDDDSFYVATSDDANIKISFQMSYHFIEGKVSETYNNFRGLDGEQIVDSRVKTVLKSEVSEVTTDYSIMTLYSGNRSEVNDKLTEYLNERFQKKYGIEVTDASIIDVHPSKTLKKTINARVKAQQAKAQAKAEQETVKVKAETEVIEAEADQKVKKINADTAAYVNAKKAKSITDKTLKEEWIEKWDGKLPSTTVGSQSSVYYGLK